MSKVLGWVSSRLLEPSTWCGMGLVVSSIHMRDWGAAIQAAAGVLGIVIPEKKV